MGFYSQGAVDWIFTFESGEFPFFFAQYSNFNCQKLIGVRKVKLMEASSLHRFLPSTLLVVRSEALNQLKNRERSDRAESPSIVFRRKKRALEFSEELNHFAIVYPRKISFMLIYSMI